MKIWSSPSPKEDILKNIGNHVNGSYWLP